MHLLLFLYRRLRCRLTTGYADYIFQMFSSSYMSPSVMQIASFRCFLPVICHHRLCRLHLSDVFFQLYVATGYADYIFQMFSSSCMSPLVTQITSCRCLSINLTSFFCVSHLPMKLLIYGYKKGVEIVSMFYL